MAWMRRREAGRDAEKTALSTGNQSKVAPQETSIYTRLLLYRGSER
jgi:hypothetical protein